MGNLTKPFETSLGYYELILLYGQQRMNSNTTTSDYFISMNIRKG